MNALSIAGARSAEQCGIRETKLSESSMGIFVTRNNRAVGSIYEEKIAAF